MRWLLCPLVLALAAFASNAQTPPSKGKEPAKSAATDVPKYAGKTFEQWVKELQTLKDPSRRETAIRAICLFPPEKSIKALPEFVKELRKHSAGTPVDLSVRCHLCIAIGELFATGERIDPKDVAAAILALRVQLNDSQLILRYRAASALAAIGQDAKAAIPDFLRMIDERSTWELRQAAAAALGSIGGDNVNGPRPEVLKSLYERLKDPASEVRIAAVRSLTILGPIAGEPETFVGALLPVARYDPEPGLQIWSRVAIIGATSDFAKDNIEPIVKHMASEEPGVRVSAIQAIGTMGPRAKFAVNGLLKSLNDTEPMVVASAMWALGRMESAGVEAIPVLRKISVDPNQSDYMKKLALDTISKITGERAAEK